MSAHDDLLSKRLTVYEIQVILEEHAHELAEKIRQHPWRECCGAGCSDLAAVAADLIDPESDRE